MSNPTAHIVDLGGQIRCGNLALEGAPTIGEPPGWFYEEIDGDRHYARRAEVEPLSRGEIPLCDLCAADSIRRSIAADHIRKATLKQADIDLGKAERRYEAAEENLDAARRETGELKKKLQQAIDDGHEEIADRELETCGYRGEAERLRGAVENQLAGFDEADILETPELLALAQALAPESGEGVAVVPAATICCGRTKSPPAATLRRAVWVCSEPCEPAPSPSPEAGEISEAVMLFAAKMEERLLANDHKGGWDGCDPGWLLGRLRDEVSELDATGFTDDASADPSGECADVANFAMMIFDNTRPWHKPAASEEESDGS